MRGRELQVLDFSDTAASNGSLAAPGTPFGQLLAAASDEANDGVVLVGRRWRSASDWQQSYDFSICLLHSSR